MFLEISQNSQARNFIKKETLAQMFSCEFWQISKNSFSYRTPQVAASKYRFFTENFENIYFEEQLRVVASGIN